MTKLHDAARCGNTAALKLLIDAGSNVNARNEFGDTPVMWAARCGHTKIVEILKNHRRKK